MSVTCRTCGKVDTSGELRPEGWWRLHKTGEGKIARDEPAPGNYHDVDCLIVGTLAAVGLTEDQVRAWLAGSPAMAR